MRSRPVVPERKITVIFHSGRKKESLETWRYWEIVEALQWMGTDRITAHETAKALQRAKPQPEQEVWPGITMEIVLTN